MWSLTRVVSHQRGLSSEILPWLGCVSPLVSQIAFHWEISLSFPLGNQSQLSTERAVSVFHWEISLSFPLGNQSQFSTGRAVSFPLGEQSQFSTGKAVSFPLGKQSQFPTGKILNDIKMYSEIPKEGPPFFQFQPSPCFLGDCHSRTC